MKQFEIVLCTGAVLSAHAICLAGSATFNSGGTGPAAFSCSITRGVNNQQLGRAFLDATSGSPTVTQVTLSLAGPSHTGLSNLEIWTTTSSTFVSAVQFGSTVAADPGSADFTFTGSATLTMPTYFWLVGDVDPGATGTIIPRVLGVTMGAGDTLNSFTPPQPMISNYPAALPVSFSSFSVE